MDLRSIFALLVLCLAGCQADDFVSAVPVRLVEVNGNFSYTVSPEWDTVAFRKNLQRVLDSAKQPYRLLPDGRLMIPRSLSENQELFAIYCHKARNVEYLRQLPAAKEP